MPTFFEQNSAMLTPFIIGIPGGDSACQLPRPGKAI
jgi:hypothetical protein